MRATLVALVMAGLAFATLAGGQASLGACPVFPPDNAWNQPVDTLPAAPNSDAVIAATGAGDSGHADFGSGTYAGGPIGIPVTTRIGRKVRPRFEFADESDKGPYPLPRKIAIEGGSRSDGDRHSLIVDRKRCRLYELYRLFPGGRKPKADSGAIFDLRSNKLRPEGWTSADAAGLPIFPGLARFEEVSAGEIKHAIRFTVKRTRNAFVYPARHAASDLTDPDLPPLGMRFRLKSSVDIAGFPPQSRVILTAMQRYGLILADNGSNWFFSGAPSPGWHNDDLSSLKAVKGSDFEVVDTSSLPKPGL